MSATNDAVPVSRRITQNSVPFVGDGAVKKSLSPTVTKPSGVQVGVVQGRGGRSALSNTGMATPGAQVPELERLGSRQSP